MKSCNCGEHQRPQYPPNQSTQPRNPEEHSPRWSPRESQRSPRSSNAAKPTESESPSTGNGKLDAERSGSNKSTSRMKKISRQRI